jgi:hypothetical protein
MNNMDSRLRGNDGHKKGIFGGTPGVHDIDHIGINMIFLAIVRVQYESALLSNPVIRV